MKEEAWQIKENNKNKISMFPKLKRWISQYIYFRQEKEKTFLIFAQKCKVNPEIGSEHYRELNPRRSLIKNNLEKKTKHKLQEKNSKTRKIFIGKIKKNANAPAKKRKRDGKNKGLETNTSV